MLQHIPHDLRVVSTARVYNNNHNSRASYKQPDHLVAFQRPNGFADHVVTHSYSYIVTYDVVTHRSAYKLTISR